MKLTIEVPDATFKRFMDDWVDSPAILKAVRNGEPLKKGKWITEKFVTICICSECGYGSIIGAPKYCPDCGAEMEVDD